MNAIAKILRASPSTILQWIRDFANQHAQPPEPQTDTVVLELDEMWHYLKKKAETLDLESFVS
jgi:transposase